MVIRNIKTVNTDPAIIEVEFEPVEQSLIDEVYAPENFEQLAFENLVVNEGRLKVNSESKSFGSLRDHFKPAYKHITKALADLDKVRYPIFRDFDNWWDSNNLENKFVFLAVQDMPGFDQPYHLDFRFSMWAGIINLQDNDIGTIFTKDHKDYSDLSYYYQASGKKFTGTFWLNTENNWHSVPKVISNRKVVVCNQTLTI